MFKRPAFVNFRNKAMNFNPPKQICNHLLGNQHTNLHRMAVGTAIIITGVFISELGKGSLHLIFDAFGYFVHGIGSIPFIERIEKWRSEA